MAEQDLPIDDDPIPPITRATIALFERTRPLADRTENINDWFNAPEDMEGVVTRIGSMALMFGGAILVSVTLCTLTFIINMIVGYIHCINVGITSCTFGP